uniref:RhuM family protein n=1 Tax=Prevotella sp. TaxID=59823 RepID=UPI003FEE8A76
MTLRSTQPHVAQLKEGELNKYSVIQKTWITATEGKRYEANVYNLDMIIAVGYRVNSYKATRFR